MTLGWTVTFKNFQNSPPLLFVKMYSAHTAYFLSLSNSYIVHTLTSSVTNLPNITIIFHEKWCDQHFTSMGQRKRLSPRQELNLWPSAHWSHALTTELWRIRGKFGYIQGVLDQRIKCVLCTARISIGKIIMCMINKGWCKVNSKLGEEMRNNVINMSWASNKGKNSESMNF